MACQLKKPFNLFKRWQFYATVVFLTVFIKMSFGYFGEAVQLYIYQKSRSYAETIVSKTIQEDILTNYTAEGFIQKNYDSTGKLTLASLDSYQANLVRAQVAKSLIKSIESINLQEDFQSLMIPLGYFFSRNYFLANGIRVPINLEIIGSAKSDINSNVKSYGINSSLIEIVLDVSIEMQIMVPFQQQKIDILYEIPLAMEIINSDVPFVYGQGS